MHMSMICERDPPGITGHVCQKSPSSIIAFPLKGLLLFMTRLQTSPIHVNAARFSIEALSKVMRPALLSSSPWLWFFCIGEFSS